MKKIKTERQKLVERYQNCRTNEDLLAAQRLFYKQQQQTQPNGPHQNGDRDTPTDAKRNRQRAPSSSSPSSSSQAQTQYQMPTLAIVGDITEKNTSTFNDHPASISSFRITDTERGFPSVLTHNHDEITANVRLHATDSMWHHQQFLGMNTEDAAHTLTAPSAKPPVPQSKPQKLSLFAQRMQSKTNKQLQVQSEPTSQSTSTAASCQRDDPRHHHHHQQPPPHDDGANDATETATAGATFIQKLNAQCNIITNNELTAIQSENDSFLQQHNEAEILEMRQQLIAKLDPKLIALLTGKQSSPPPPQPHPPKSKSKIKMCYDHDNDDDDDEEQKSNPAVIRSHASPPKPAQPSSSSSTSSTSFADATDERQWMHPAQRITASMDFSSDRNNDIPGPTQTEKMRWMQPLNVQEEQAKYEETHKTPMMLGDNPLEYYRFGFDGAVLCDHKGRVVDGDGDAAKTDDPDLYSGLHHHGDEPLKPGYTINELLHLCKSTVANQRSTAIKTMACVVAKMRGGVYGVEYSEYLWILLQEKKMVLLMVDILAMEKTVSCLAPILDVLHAIMVPLHILLSPSSSSENHRHRNAEIESLVFDGYHILCNTLPNVVPAGLRSNQSLLSFFDDGKAAKTPYERGNIQAPKKLGREKDKDTQDVWQADVVLALTRETNILRYLSQILQKYVLPDLAHSHAYTPNLLPALLDVLLTFASHDPRIVQQMVDTPKLINALFYILHCSQSPGQVVQMTAYKCRVMDIIAVMCQMNVGVVHYLDKNHRFAEFKQFVMEGLNHMHDANRLQLSISALQIWRVCVKYGYDFNAFVDLIPSRMIFEMLSKFRLRFQQKHENVQKISSAEIARLQQKQMRALLNIVFLLLQQLTPRNVSRLPSLTSVTWNQMAKIAQQMSPIFAQFVSSDFVSNLQAMDDVDWVYIAGLVHVMSAYYETLPQQTDETLGQAFQEFSENTKTQIMNFVKQYVATWSAPTENRLLSTLLLNKQNWTHNNIQQSAENLCLLKFPFLDGLLCDIPRSIAVLPNRKYCAKCDCLLAVVKLVHAMAKIHTHVIPILIRSQFLDAIARILLQITSKHFHFRLNRSLRSKLFHHWRIEFLLGVEILTLLQICFSDLSQLHSLQTMSATSIHSAACVLLECAPPGYQHLGHQLWRQFIVSPKYLSRLRQQTVTHLRARKDTHLLNGELSTFYIENEIHAFSKQLNVAYAQHDKFVSRVFDPRVVEICRLNHSFVDASKITSLSCIPSMVPTFWMLQPLVNLYRHKIPVSSITAVLHFFFIVSRSYRSLEDVNSDDENDEEVSETFSVTSLKSHHYWCNTAVWDTYRSVATLYLCDSNVYSDALHHVLLSYLMQQCWHRIGANDSDDTLYLCDANDPSSACIVDTEIDEIASSANDVKSLGREWQAFFTKMVEQFESDSFGDALFAKLLLFQQQMTYNKQFRMVAWHNMDSLAILLQHAYPPNLYEWKAFFMPFESDKVIIDLQFQSLLSAKFHSLARFNRSFLYLVAIVHVSHFIWSSVEQTQTYDKHLMQNVLSQCENYVIVDVMNCNFDEKNLQSLMIIEEENCVSQLRQYLNVGHANIVKQAHNQTRVSLLRNDFSSACDNLSLF